MARAHVQELSKSYAHVLLKYAGHVFWFKFCFVHFMLFLVQLLPCLAVKLPSGAAKVGPYLWRNLVFAQWSILSSAAIFGDCNSFGACGLFALSYWLGVFAAVW
ncbi:hypothetical protein U1Q18_024004 [Sarracenia purpurea var. burkii]